MCNFKYLTFNQNPVMHPHSIPLLHKYPHYLNIFKDPFGVSQGFVVEKVKNVSQYMNAKLLCSKTSHVGKM